MRPAPLHFAALAGIFDDLSLAAAVGAGSHNAEKALLVAHLPAPLAGDAGIRRGSLFGSLAFAFLAFFEARDVKLFLFSGGGFFQGNFQIVAQIRPALCRRAARARACPEHIAKAEEIENVFDVSGKPGGAVACAGTCAHALMTETVIGCAFLRVGKHRVGFRRFFKFFFRLGVAGIFVRMMLDRQLAVSRFNFGFGRGAADA
jgi:hypothetical protein